MRKWIKHKGKPAVLIEDTEIEMITKAVKPVKKKSKKKSIKTITNEEQE